MTFKTIEVNQITKLQAKSLIEKFHYLGEKGFRCEVAFGLFEDSDFIGVAVFHGPSAPETVVGAFGLSRADQNGIYELGRLVLLPDRNGKNYGSMLIGRSIKLLRKLKPVRAVITYAESTRHYGAVYQATNFIYCGTSTPKKDFYLADGTKQERGKTKGVAGSWVNRPLKHRYVMLFDKTLNLKWVRKPYVKAVEISQ
jgi:GNAT superfamily N-acetyltransferase